MTYTILGQEARIALLPATLPCLCEANEALERLFSVQFESSCTQFILPKACLSEAFFDLRTGLAGEMLQKFVNYGLRCAIVGDFSLYTSKALHDFIYESNQGKHVYFAATVEEAIEFLSR